MRCNIDKIIRRISLVFAGFVFTGLFSACSDGFEAFEGSGKVITESRNVGSFNTIVLNDNINVVIGFDSACSLRIEGPENWMDEIVTEVTDQRLMMRNTSTWLWLKDPKKKVTAYLTMPYLAGLQSYGTGSVDSEDTLRYGRILVEAMDGCGSIRLLLDADSLYVKNMDGVKDIRVEGRADYLYLFNSTVSMIDCRRLESNIARVIHHGSNNCFVNTKKLLSVTISRMGDVYYSGNPDTVISAITGSGQLIPF